MWGLSSVRAYSQDLQALLECGWEPFAVTEDDVGATVWLRKQSAVTIKSSNED